METTNLQAKEKTQWNKSSVSFLSGRQLLNTLWGRSEYLVLAGTVLLLLASATWMYNLQAEFDALHFARMSSWGGRILIGTSLLLLSFHLLFYIFLFVLYRKYKPLESVTDEELPICTVIVPAYNEGELVLKTLRSLAASEYPSDKLQLICIDDGSKDDTWEWIKQAKSELGNRVDIYQQAQNGGKRKALYRGFRLAKGEVLVTVDSDSIVKPSTLRNLVTPLVLDAKCGAVAGNVKVLNTGNAIIPKMLNVSFAFSFEFIRSAQSVLSSVLCTPGALAAYRKTAVMNCLQEWISQKFLGQHTDIGEDRALTNMIMKQGYGIRFQSNALVLTNTPENYPGLYKMFVRWERSNVRENIMMSKFAFTKFREGSTLGPRILLVNQWLNVLSAYPALLFMLIFILTHPILFMSSSLFSILIFSSLPALFFARKRKSLDSMWAYSYGVFYMFTLFWITPYAIATASRRGWLTRN